MPTIARRTPITEEAASYGYRDLLKDIIGKISTGATSNVERMTSGGMSEGELLETALAPAGGMLKIAGTSKLLAGLLSRQKKSLATYLSHKVGPERWAKDIVSARYRPARSVFKESLKVPEKEYGRIKGINWESMAGQQLGTKGLYDPWGKKIALHPTLADIKTVWHEFTHARQWSPERGERGERASAEVLRFLNEELARRSSLSRGGDFYYNISPIEKQARAMGTAMTKGARPSEFSSVYRKLLENVLEEGEKRVGPQLVREFWDIALQRYK